MSFDPLHAPDLELELELAYGHMPEPQLPATPPTRPVPGCTGKQAYADAVQARTAINHRERRGSERLRAYPCHACGRWHLARRR